MGSDGVTEHEASPAAFKTSVFVAVFPTQMKERLALARIPAFYSGCLPLAHEHIPLRSEPMPYIEGSFGFFGIPVFSGIGIYEGRREIYQQQIEACRAQRLGYAMRLDIEIRMRQPVALEFPSEEIAKSLLVALKREKISNDGEIPV